jgi:hypothetical protein
MKRIQLVLLLICVASVAMTGCRGGGEIYNVKDAPVMTASGGSPSLEEVQKAIIAAGAGLNWSMAVAKPGHIVGTLNIRSHQAVVDILHNTKTYSIIYKDSTNSEIRRREENDPRKLSELDSALR